jgi:hypothetical protein
MCTGLLAFCVQSGELGSADTMHRLQTAHSFWTSQPAVSPNEYPEFGVHGRGGKLYDWYGIGQPLLLLPFDIIGTGISKLSIFDDYGRDTDPTVRNIFVTYSVNILISVLTALVCFRFLPLLGFDSRESTAGVLALLFCTTHLHYTQNMMENNYILLLTMTGFCFQYEWLQTGSRRALLIGSAALGLNLLTRLTTGLDLIAAGVFLLLVLRFKRALGISSALVGTAASGRGPQTARFSPTGVVARPIERSSTAISGRAFGQFAVTYSKTALPIYAVFLLLDRLYQFYRFGNWTTTYVHYFTIEHRLQDRTLPAKYPWETPFHVGFLGPLISPEKSIFLFDPLIVLTIVVSAVLFLRRRVPSRRDSVESARYPGLTPWAKLDHPSEVAARGRTAEMTEANACESAKSNSEDEFDLMRPVDCFAGVKAYVIASFLLVLGYICLYARYTVWSGNFAWGDRYVSTAAEMAAFISVPLLIRFRAQLTKPVWALGLFLICASLIIQLASLAFWLPLEIYQIQDLGSQFVIWLRFKNIVAFALGKMDAWGLNTDAMGYDHWDYQHINTWNFLPFVLRRMGAAPRWVVDVVFAVWGAGTAAVACSLWELRSKISYGQK